MGTDAVLSQIGELLVAHVPHRVKALGIKEPVYCLMIEYLGSDVLGDRSPLLLLPTERQRQLVLAQKTSNALHYLWTPGEIDCIEGVHRAGLDEPLISRLCKEWYHKFDLTENLPVPDDLLPMRKMVQRAAMRLNRLNWRELVKATSDFVVIAADGSCEFGDPYADLIASVPDKQLDLLRSRDLLRSTSWYQTDEEDEE